MASVTGTDFCLTKCIYDIEDQDRILRHAVDEAVTAAEKSDGSVDKEIAADRFAELFLQIAPVLKHPSFSEECEWRLVSGPLHIEDERVRHREAATGIVPYAAIEILDEEGKLPLTEVLVGPTPQIDYSVDAVRSLARRNDLAIKMGASGTPYREYST